VSKIKPKGKSGLFSLFRTPFREKRHIVIAEGIEFHESEIGVKSVFGYLKQNLGADFVVDSAGLNAEYKSEAQQVDYTLEVVHKKSAFKKALETDGIIVVYAGHSRYGRGACFDQYTGKRKVDGKQWENGTNDDNGLFRLGFPYVPVSEHDISTHKYQFSPVPVESGPIKRKKGHPYDFEEEFRIKPIKKFILPEDLRGLVIPGYESETNEYYGFYKREGGKQVRHFILNAGWDNTQCPNHELGSVNLKCRTFCHFGCSSKDHFWQIIRHEKYKAWKRPNPPTEKFAYFTTAPGIVWHLWVYHLLTFSEENDPADNDKHWWRSHQHAKYATNYDPQARKHGIKVY
jgi:hypothetical protein